MSTIFPQGLDIFVNPDPNSLLNSPPHNEQHANANDAIAALETKVGINGSNDPNSLEYRLTNNPNVGNALTLQGQLVSSVLPSTGQVLEFNGTQWIPATIVDNDSSSGGGGGGSTNATTLQGNAISASPPVSGQILGWNGSNWAPVSNARSTTFVVAASNTSLANKTGADYVCSGINDHTTIQNAINALPATGGKIIFTDGFFSFGGVISALKSNLILEGQGYSTWFVLANNVNTQMINSITSLSNIVIDSIRFDGNGSNQSDQVSRDSLCMLYFIGINYLRIKNCTIQNGRHGAQVRLSTCNYASITDNQAYNMGLSGTLQCDAFFCRNSTHYRAIGNTIIGGTNPDTGFAQDGVDHSIVANNTITLMNGGISVSMSAIEGSTPAASSNNNVVANNTISGQGGVSGTSAGIKVSSYGNPGNGQLHDVTITGNVIDNCDRALWLEQVDRLVVADNVLHDAAGANKQIVLLSTTGVMNDFSFHGNTLYNTTNRGMSFDAGTFGGRTIIENNNFISTAVPIGGTLPVGIITKNNPGYNPLTVTTPAFPATNVVYTNNTGVDLHIYLTNGTGSMTTQINGVAGPTIAASATLHLFIPAGGTFRPTYGSGAPSWVFSGN